MSNESVDFAHRGGDVRFFTAIRMENPHETKEARGCSSVYDEHDSSLAELKPWHWRCTLLSSSFSRGRESRGTGGRGGGEKKRRDICTKL